MSKTLYLDIFVVLSGHYLSNLSNPPYRPRKTLDPCRKVTHTVICISRRHKNLENSPSPRDFPYIVPRCLKDISRSIVYKRRNTRYGRDGDITFLSILWLPYRSKLIPELICLRLYIISPYNFSLLDDSEYSGIVLGNFLYFA